MALFLAPTPLRFALGRHWLGRSFVRLRRQADHYRHDLGRDVIAGLFAHEPISEWYALDYLPIPRIVCLVDRLQLICERVSHEFIAPVALTAFVQCFFRRMALGFGQYPQASSVHVHICFSDKRRQRAVIGGWVSDIKYLAFGVGHDRKPFARMSKRSRSKGQFPFPFYKDNVPSGES